VIKVQYKLYDISDEPAGSVFKCVEYTANKYNVSPTTVWNPHCDRKDNSGFLKSRMFLMLQVYFLISCLSYFCIHH